MVRFAALGGGVFKSAVQGRPRPNVSWLARAGGLVIALGCLSLVGGARAASDGAAAIRVGIYHGPPKVFWDQQGQPAGFFPEVLREIARREGWVIEYVHCEWPLCLQALEAGELDLMTDVSYSQQRDTRFDFNREVLFPSWSVVFARRGVTIQSVLNLHGKRIAVLENGIQYEALQATAQEFNIQPIFVQLPDYDQMFDLLHQGQVDGVVVNRFFAAQRNFPQAVNTNILIRPDQVHFAAPQGDPAGLLPAIDRQLAAMKNEPDSIYYQSGDRWLQGLDIHKPDWVLILALGGGLAALGLAASATVLVVWNQRLQHEIKRRMAVQQQLQHKLLHDSLTDLPNRYFLMTRLKACLAHCRTTGQLGGALLFLDLDRFKVVNDSLGHTTGDQLIVEMANRLKQTGHWVARLGGDEFVIHLENMTDRIAVTSVADVVLATLQQPCWLNNHEVVVRGSIGIVIGFNDYSDPSDLLRDADIAMYWSKAHGRNSYTIFTQEMGALATRQLALERELHRAIEQQELVLHYQPIVGLKSSRLIGFEALVRWQHPQRGLLSPGEFIPLAEDVGLIVPLGWWVLETACRQLQQWQADNLHNPSLTINVNVSAAQLQQADFLTRLDQILALTGLAGESLVLEITESLLINNLSETCYLLQQLRNRSIGISIDDFGTGYSSFGSLHHLPITNLKIDRSFIGRMVESCRNQDIVRTIVMLAHQLGVKATAEGIETEDQRQMLEILECDLGQGYLFDRPLPVEALQLWLKGAAVSLKR